MGLRTLLVLCAAADAASAYSLLSMPSSQRVVASSSTAAAAAAPPRAALAAVNIQTRHPSVRMEDEEPDPKVVIKDMEGKMKKSAASVQESLSSLRVGRASPSLLDRVTVNYYDTPTPLNQLASVTAATATQLVVDVYDKSALGDVERAILESDVGMTPNNDGSVIRLNVPQMTEERRKELAKTAKSLGEDGKVALRNIRKSALKDIKNAIKDAEDAVTKSTKKFEGEVDKLVADREKEILTV